jgi:hypothetical protein
MIMNKAPFDIEFFLREKSKGKPARVRVYKYSACINVISETFQLFQVTNIKKTGNDYVSATSNDYLITTYPSDKIKAERWKDAATFETNNFVKTIGAAIEKRIDY